VVAPSEDGGWTMTAWDGWHWYDRFSGAILDPEFYAALPSVEP